MASFIVRAAQPDEYVQVGEMVANVFFHTRPRVYERFLHHWIATRPHEPGFRYALHRIGVLDGRIVAHVRIKPYMLKYGSAYLGAGGFGEVCSHGDYRGAGYGAQVMQDAIAFLAEQGAQLALLDGISNYYDRFGFSPVWPVYHLEANSSEAAALDSPLRMRDALPDDVPALAALYERHFGGRVTTVRDGRSWEWRIKGSYPVGAQVVVGKTGEVCGYIVGLGWEQERVEVVADTPEAALTLLAAGGRACQEAGVPKLRWLVPPDDALVSFARQFLTVTVSAIYRPSGSWMGRLIDARGAIDRLLPEISAQATATDPAFDAEMLVVEPGGQGVRIGLRTIPASVCQLNYRDFIQILFGSLRPAALAVRPYSQLQPEGLRLLETLFPPRMALFGWWDWF
jgi:predicted N-acetyltransferase YhbS